MKVINSDTMEQIGVLNRDDVELLKQGYAKSKYPPAIISILERLREEKRFLECDCISNSSNPPTMGIRKLGEGNFILANLPGRQQHSDKCLLSYRRVTGTQTVDREMHDPAVNQRDNGYLGINTEGIATLYRKLIHNSGLNSISTYNWKPTDFESNLIDGARLSPEIAKFGLSKKIHYGFKSIQNAKDILASAEHGEYQICINPISEFDNRSINLSLSDDKSYWVDAGELTINSCTTKGPFVAVTVLGKFKESVITLGSHIEPILSKWHPVPIKSNAHRELAFEFIRKGGVFNRPEYQSREYQLIIPMLAMKAPISELEINPDLVVQGKNGRVLLGHPDKAQRQGFNELGKFQWFRDLPPIKDRRKAELVKLTNSILSVI